MHPDALLSAAEAARALGIPSATVRTWAHRGKLRAAGVDRSGRAVFAAADVRALVDGCVGSSAQQAGEPCRVRGCGRPVADALVCSACADRLAADLGDVAALVRELDVTLSGQARIASTGKPAKPRPASPDEEESPVPFDSRVSPALQRLREALVLCVDELAVAEPPIGPAHPRCEHCSCAAVRAARRPAGDVVAMAAWLLARLERVRHHQAAEALVDAVSSAVARVRWVIDRPPDLVYAGPCDSPVGEPDISGCGCGCHGGPLRKCDTAEGCWAAHERPTCGLDLYAVAGARSVTCRGCGVEYSIEERRKWLLAAVEDMLENATAIARFLSAFGDSISADRIRKWAERGRIAAHGVDAGGRPTYRVGDVLDALAGTIAREPRSRIRAS